MIKIYKSTENGLIHLDEFIPNCWINVVDPTPDEIERLTVEGIPMDFITYPLDLDERARTEREDDGKMLILIRIPYYQGPKADAPYITIPLGIILTDRYIITVCRWQTDIIREFESGRVKGLSTAKRIRFVLRILLSNASKFLAYLREINRNVEQTEDRLQQSQQNKEVLELLQYQKSLVYFTTALKANELLLERLQRTQLFRMYPDDEDLLEDVITENQQAIEMVNISSNILSSMMDAFASIISNNLNVVMKILASVTILVSLPTMITSFYGMNVELPLQENPIAWELILGVCLFMIGIALYIFARKRWF
ncbi:MAG TPA: magnesium transporter [Anaerolineaceae bacterium]|jgi:magnesium transporter|nr:magnesium transporter [Anaerolineaceae bacterium]